MLQLQHQDYVLVRTQKLQKPQTCQQIQMWLHVDTGQFKPVEQRVNRELRFCSVCATDIAEDEHHFVFECPAYCSIRDRFTAIFCRPPGTSPYFVFFLHFT